MNQMPPITKNLLIINVLFYLGTLAAESNGVDLSDWFGLHFVLASDFKAYQLFTYMFMHGGLSHLFFNMFAVWMFGRIIEQSLGSQRFLFYYLTCGLGAGLVQELVQGAQYLYYGFSGYEQVALGGGVYLPMAEYLNRWCTVGASGCVYGVLLAFGMMYPNERMFIFPLPVPIRAKYFVMGYAVIELLSALGNRGDGIAHMAHLGGMLFGLLLLLYWKNGGGQGRRGGFTHYGRDSFSDRWRKWFSALKQKKQSSQHRYDPDMAYRQRKKEQSAEMDRILDKVRQHGYGCLTEEEKKRLFDMSKK